MKFLILAAALALTGCASTGFTNTEVLVTKEYVVRKAPDTLKTLPPLPVALANPKTATNTQVAQFISSTEEYIANLEAMIVVLVNFYEKPVTSAENEKLKPAVAVPPRAAASAPAATPASFSSPRERAARAGQ